MSRVRRNGADWTPLVLAYVVLVSAADSLLLERSQTFFTAGFNAGYARGIPQLTAFFAVSALLDVWLMVGVLAVATPLLGRLRGTEWQRIVSGWLVALALPFSIDFVRYRIGVVLGDLADLGALLEVSAGSVRIMISEAAIQAGPLLGSLLVAGALSFGFVHALGRVQRATGWRASVRRPTSKGLWLAFLVLSLCAPTAFVVTANVSSNLYAGLAEKPSGWLLERVIQRATDIDFDGFGVLSRPADPAPFDGSRHAFALDVAGNGIDENGLAGDLPLDVTSLRVVASSPVVGGAAPTRRPDLLLVYLESFRADLIGLERDHVAVTPFLNSLAAEGSISERAYVHSPYTLWSRAQLFGGALVPYRGQDTLVDDFVASGYTVAMFSGQDDSFGGSAEFTGRDRAHIVYDARADVDHRTTRSANPASLQVSASLVLERVSAFLAGDGQPWDREKPLFLYVNFVDTHFPYTHDEIEDLLGVDPLPRSQIRPENALRLRATYENTAANVDRVARELVATFRRSRGGRDHAILVTADHGQAFYERGFLGHGQALTDDQTRAPFILWGIGGDWPEPLGMADVRGLLRQHLFRAEALVPARFVPDPDRRLLHFMARIAAPRVIGLRSLAGLSSYDFTHDRFELFDAHDGPLETGERDRQRAFEELIHVWEATRAD